MWSMEGQKLKLGDLEQNANVKITHKKGHAALRVSGVITDEAILFLFLLIQNNSLGYF